MAKLWAGRTSGETNRAADDFNSSLHFDQRLFRQDIKASAAHAEMLANCAILSPAEKDAILQGLDGILKDLESGSLSFGNEAEDIHMFVEEELTKRIGDTGKKLHTARSRNDQVAQDLRLYVKEESEKISLLLKDLISSLVFQAEKEEESVMPGYTHLQRAQPISFSQQMMAYVFMFFRDLDRLSDAKKRLDVSPIGSCALAGTTYPTDRLSEALSLGFSGVSENSVDGVSDRDFCVEYLAAFSLIMMHLSRLSEEIVLWSSWEFGFVSLSDDYTTGSSIMPQKKNPDMAELCRGKTGRVYGDLFSLLTMLKGLPLAYNKDMQEDKEAVFDAVDTVKACLGIMAPMIRTMKVNRAAMLKAAQKGFINATDLADFLTKKGMPFRAAYQLSGEIVRWCIQKDTVLEEVPLETYRGFSPLFDETLYAEIDLKACAAKRISYGGTGAESVKKQIQIAKEKLQ